MFRHAGGGGELKLSCLVSIFYNYTICSTPPFSDEASEGLSRRYLSLAGSPLTRTLSLHPLTSPAVASSLKAAKWPHTPSERLYQSHLTRFRYVDQ